MEEFFGIFSYGIEFRVKYYRDFIGLLFSALWDIPGIEKQFPSINEFFTLDYDILEYKLNWAEHTEQFGLFKDFVNEYWKKIGNQSFLDIFLNKSGVPNARICIKDTLKAVDLSGFNEYSINIEKADTRLWENQLKVKCQRMGVPYENPAFRLVLSSQEGDEVPDVYSELFYGISIDQQKSPLIRKTYTDNHDSGERKIEEWGEQDPTCLLLFIGEAEEHSYLSIRNAVKKQYLENGTWSFEINGLDTTIWDSLLKTKFNQYKIPWRKPGFHLNLSQT